MWEELKRKILQEIKRFLSCESQINGSEVVDLLQDIFILPLERPELKLDGVTDRIPKAIQKILDEKSSKDDIYTSFSDFCKVESYLRKILFLINEPEFSRIESNRLGLAAIIKSLNLNPNRINFEDKSLEKTLDEDKFDLHLYRVYKLRNIESHHCESWTNRELGENIESVLIFYTYVTYKNYCKLREVANSMNRKIDFSQYLNNVKDNFKNKIGRFVHIEGLEDIKLLEGYVIEHVTDDEQDEFERKGTVDYLRKNRISEKRMMIWGDAGMGKSTTLEYLAYIDSEQKVKCSSEKLPIYVSLGMLTDKDLSIKEYIFKKIGVDTLTGEELLEKGEINLFLDAVNEIPKDDSLILQSRRKKEIQEMLDKYKKTFIIISNRSERNNTFKGIPVFRLQKMDKDKIIEFVNKNIEGNEVISKKILDEIEKDKRLEKIISTPLMLSRLIEIVKLKGEIPKSEGEIIDEFIKSLYRRERIEKMDLNFDDHKIHYMLRRVGYNSLEKKGTNSAMTEEEILNYFIECIKDYSFQIDTFYVLEKVTQLGILEKQDNMYVFAHQAYQDYYHAQEEKAILCL